MTKINFNPKYWRKSIDNKNRLELQQKDGNFTAGYTKIGKSWWLFETDKKFKSQSMPGVYDRKKQALRVIENMTSCKLISEKNKYGNIVTKREDCK